MPCPIGPTPRCPAAGTATRSKRVRPTPERPCLSRARPTDRYKLGDENVHAGRGTFYKLRYGPYVIAMNCPKDRNFPLAPPVGEGPLQALTGGKAPVKAGSTVVVGPGATAVYYVGP